MAMAFTSTKGKAIKTAVETYAYKDGDNTVRFFGGVLPRYVYWLKGTNNKDIPLECLSFDRDEEKFNNLLTDHVREFFPDLKCSWAYVINCIDPRDGKAKAIHLKKKLFEEIMTAAEDLGDPTDPDTGWDVVFKRTKTGPSNFNVSYSLMVLKCKKRALTEEERAVIAAADSIDKKYPRQTAEEQRKQLEKLASGGEDTPDDTAGSDAVPEEARDL